MFAAALFLITPEGELLKYPSTGEQADRVWHTHTLQNYVAMKTNDLQWYANNVSIDESHQRRVRDARHKTTLHLISFKWNLKTGQTNTGLDSGWLSFRGCDGILQSLKNLKLFLVTLELSGQEFLLQEPWQMGQLKTTPRLVLPWASPPCTDLQSELCYTATPTPDPQRTAKGSA